MAALRRQRPVQLADVEFGGGQPDPVDVNDPDRIKRQVDVAGQAYKNQQQQQQQPDLKDRYILALESALVLLQTNNEKLADQVLVQTQSVDKNQANGFAAVLLQLKALETRVASLKETPTEPETPTPEPEPIVSKCLEHLLKEAGREPVQVDKALQHVAGQMLGRLDRLEVVFNATRDHLAAIFKNNQDHNEAGFERVEGNQNKTVKGLEASFNASFLQLEKNANASFLYLEKNTNGSILHLEKNANASRDQVLQRLNRLEADKSKMAADLHRRFEQQDVVLNQTHAFSANTSARLNECIREAFEQDQVPLQPMYGQLWTYLTNLWHDSVPPNSDLWHPQNLFQLVLSPNIWFGPVMALVSHFFDSRLSSRVAACLGVRRPIYSKASLNIQSKAAFFF